VLDDPSVFQTAFLRRFELWKPIVAAVNGFALAGGTELLQGTDLRFASEKATFALTEASRGLLPGGGSTARLPRQVPYVEAMRILLVAEHFNAAEAKRIGFVNDVVPSERLMEIALATAEKIAANGPVAVRKIKESVIRGSGRSLDEAYGVEDECLSVVMRTEDAKEGPRAFMEKRKPSFTGR
jgi:enoyl-CoA hydratase